MKNLICREKQLQEKSNETAFSYRFSLDNETQVYLGYSNLDVDVLDKVDISLTETPKGTALVCVMKSCEDGNICINLKEQKSLIFYTELSINASSSCYFAKELLELKVGKTYYLHTD